MPPGALLAARTGQEGVGTYKVTGEDFDRPNSDVEPCCYYCGQVAQSTDHVVPRSMLRLLQDLGDEEVTAVLAYHRRRLTVPACLSCNSMLGNTYFQTLAERKEYVKTRLRKKYRVLLNMPEWSDREIGELEGWMQEYVIRSKIQRERVVARLRW